MTAITSTSFHATYVPVENTFGIFDETNSKTLGVISLITVLTILSLSTLLIMSQKLFGNYDHSFLRYTIVSKKKSLFVKYVKMLTYGYYSSYCSNLSNCASDRFSNVQLFYIEMQKSQIRHFITLRLLRAYRYLDPGKAKRILPPSMC